MKSSILKNKILVIFISLFFCQTVFASAPLTDSLITAKLRSKLLLEKDIQSTDINITTENGTIFLKGNIDTTLQYNRIIELAFSIDEVKKIDTSRFQFNNSPSSSLEDLVVTAKVYGRIQSLAEKNSISNNYSLRIETFNNEVHIWGQVDNASDMKVIRTFISRMEEVQKVYAKLNVRK